MDGDSFIISTGGQAISLRTSTFSILDISATSCACDQGFAKSPSR
ncbi:hypothetical protein [Microvirga soli]|nr:hypothetical protein [Microvirga soli]